MIDMTEQVKRELEAYVDKRVRPGNFVQAILENNWMAAMDTGDDDNLESMGSIRNYLKWSFPTILWGSPYIVRTWLSGVEIHQLQDLECRNPCSHHE